MTDEPNSPHSEQLAQAVAALNRIGDRLDRGIPIAILPRHWRVYVAKALRLAFYAALYTCVAALVGELLGYFSIAEAIKELLRTIPPGA